MVIKFPCKVCTKSVAKNHRKLQCSACNQWVHLKCNNLDKKSYETLNTDNQPWYCISCIRSFIPYSDLTDVQLNLTLSGTNIPSTDTTILNCPPNFKSLFKDLNDISSTAINCKYYDIIEFNKSQPEDHMSYIHLNIASLPSHIDDLRTMCNSLQVTPAVIGITETNLYPNDRNITNINLDKFSFEHCPTEARKGGALLYINSKLNYKLREDLNIYKSKELETVFVEIINPSETNLIVGCLYRHPSMCIRDFNKNYLESLLEKLNLEKKNILIMGDFNINLLHYGDSSDVSDYLESITSNSLFPFISQPTRVTSHSKTLIDNILLNFHSPSTLSGNLTISISDHMAQFVTLPCNTSEQIKPQKLSRRCFKNFKKEEFLHDLSSIKWDEHIRDDDDVNESMASFLNIFEGFLDKHAPFKLLTKKEMKSFSKPWITKGILTSINAKNKLHKKYLKSTNATSKNELFLKFKNYRNSIANITKLSKKQHYASFFNDNLNNLKNTWKGIKEIINIKSNTYNKPSSLSVNNQLLTDESDIANSFNEFFANIAGKLSQKITPTEKKYTDFLINPNENSFFIRPVLEEELATYIKSMKPGKSLGPSSLPTSLLKIAQEVISKPICIIINNSFKNGVFPDLFKVAKVIPIYKKGSKLDRSNYRPISLLSNISKIFEKLMHTRLYSFLDSCKRLYKYQFGFRTKHSTTHTLINITEAIRKALDEKSFACGVFVDLQKAFDTVNHNILLAKLNYHGIRGSTLKWFSSYLSHRSQFVSINDTISITRFITCGVPQGSILGPLLFLIYINDLHVCIEHCTAYHFADDTNLLLISNSLKKLNKHINHDLSNLVHWLRANKISLNTKKTELILFKSKNANLTKHLNFRVSGQKILPVKTIKYLGIKFDEHLSFLPHMQDLALKLSRSNGMLAKIRHYVNFETLLSIYHAIFASHLRYACQVWAHSKNAKLGRIISLQNKALKIIHFLPNNTNSNILYYLSNTLRLNTLLSYLNGVFVWEQRNSRLPTVFDDFFSQRNECRYNLRSIAKNNLIVPLKRTLTYGTNSITYQCILTWNNLPVDLKTDPGYQRSKTLFAKALFHHLIQEYL